MQVVDDQQNRCMLRGGGQQLRRGLEQMVATSIRRRRGWWLADVNSRGNFRNDLRQLARGFDTRQCCRNTWAGVARIIHCRMAIHGA